MNMKECKIIPMPISTALSDDDLVNLVAGVFRLVLKHASAEQIERIVVRLKKLVLE
jgi:hypothetical protein